MTRSEKTKYKIQVKIFHKLSVAWGNEKTKTKPHYNQMCEKGMRGGFQMGRDWISGCSKSEQSVSEKIQSVDKHSAGVTKVSLPMNIDVGDVSVDLPFLFYI